MRVREHSRVAPRPARRLGQRVPVAARKQRRRDVHLLQLRARAEVGVDLGGKVVLRVRVEAVGVAGIDQPMEHERVERKERPLLHDPLVGVGVAVGDPALPIRADAGEVVVFPTPPDRVGVPQEERRGIRAGREVHIHVGLGGAKIADQGDHGVEVAVEGAAGDGMRHVARAVELELVHAVGADHVEARLAEALVILRSRQRESSFVGLEALRAAGGQALLPRPAIAAPR